MRATVRMIQVDAGVAAFEEGAPQSRGTLRPLLLAFLVRLTHTEMLPPKIAQPRLRGAGTCSSSRYRRQW